MVIIWISISGNNSKKLSYKSVVNTNSFKVDWLNHKTRLEKAEKPLPMNVRMHNTLNRVGRWMLYTCRAV